MKISEQVYLLSPPIIQNLMISVYGSRLYQKRYTGLYNRIRTQLDEIKGLSANEIRDRQEESLHKMVVYCASQIPYYQSLFAEFGIHQNDITSIGDIKKLPTLTKQTVLSQGKNFLPKNGLKPFATQHTSGSTGTPLVLNVDEHTYKLAMALLVDHEESHRVPFGARRATFAGRMLKRADSMKPPFSRFNRAENQRLFSSYHLNERTFPYYKTELNKFQPIELIGYPSAISDLASHYIRSGSEPDFQPKAIITNSETLHHWQRQAIESVFRCPVFDYYGTAEYLIFAGQDATGLYRPNPIIGITEVDTELAADDTGRLIATSLTNTVMPLLRYELGDLATLAYPSGPKVGAPALESINGRADDYIKTKDGRSIGRIDHIFKGVSGIQEAQIIQKEPGSATIKLVKEPHTILDEQGLISNCKQRLGSDFVISIEAVYKITRGRNGKFHAVINDVDNK